jgi:hypothetical protein
LYTSAKHKTDDIARKAAFRYLFITIFCGIFSFIYEHFSHGVYSYPMMLLFLAPLLGGVIPAMIISIAHITQPSDFSRYMWDSGIATLALGMALAGVFEIYGTISDYVPIYWIASVALLTLGAITYITKLISASSSRSRN